MGGYYYTTKQGDMWDYIAYLAYGNEYQVSVLYEAAENQPYLDVYLFDAGCRIWCPEIADIGNDEDAVPDWRDEEDDSEEQQSGLEV